jgi:hypothetical protein
MTWNANVPAGTDLISDGDNVIRELKADLADALSEEGVFPGSDTANPVFKWTGKRGNTAGRPTPPSTGELYFNTELFQLEYYSGSAWTAYDLVPLLAITTSKINDLAVTTGKINTLAVTTAKIDDLAVTTGKVTDLAVTTAKVNDLAITTAKVAALAITDAKINDVASTKITGTLTTAQIADNAVTAAKIAAAVAGNGLAGGGGAALSVNVDSSSIEINSDTLRVKALGIINAMINDVAISKLTGGPLGISVGGTALSTSLFRMVSYTGDGLSSRDIAHGMGTTPSVIVIVRLDSTTETPIIWTSGMTGGVARQFSGGTSTSYISTADATNFHLSGSSVVNPAGIPMAALCFKTQ